MNAPIISDGAFRCFLVINEKGVASNREIATALGVKKEKAYPFTSMLRWRGLVDVYKSSRGELFFRRKEVDEETFKYHFDRRFWNDYKSEWNREDSQKQE